MSRLYNQSVTVLIKNHLPKKEIIIYISNSLYNSQYISNFSNFIKATKSFQWPIYIVSLIYLSILNHSKYGIEEKYSPDRGLSNGIRMFGLSKHLMRNYSTNAKRPNIGNILWVTVYCQSPDWLTDPNTQGLCKQTDD